MTVPPPADSLSPAAPILAEVAPALADNTGPGVKNLIETPPLPAGCANAWFGKANANMDVVRNAAMVEAMIIDAFLCISIDNNLR